MKWYLCVALIVVITASSGFCGNWHKRYDYDSAGEDDSSDEHLNHHFEDGKSSYSEEDQFDQDQDKFEENGSSQLGKKGHKQPGQNDQDQPEEDDQDQQEQTGQGQPEQPRQAQPDQNGQDQTEQNGQGQSEQNDQNNQFGQNGQGQQEQNDQNNQFGQNGQGQQGQNDQNNQFGQNGQGQQGQNSRGQFGQGTPTSRNQESGQGAGSSIQGGGIQLSIPQQPRGQADTLNQCFKSCRVTSEFNPVCGSDNITYNNPGRLECAKNCGVDVTLLRTSSCRVPPLSPSTDSTFNIRKIGESSTSAFNVATEASVIDNGVSLSNENSQSAPIDVASSGSAGLGTSTPVALSSVSPDVSNNTNSSVGAQSQKGSAIETSPVSIAVDGTAIQLSANTDTPVASTDSTAVNSNATLINLNPSELQIDPAIFTNTQSTVVSNA